MPASLPNDKPMDWILDIEFEVAKAFCQYSTEWKFNDFMINLIDIDYQVKWFDRSMIFRCPFVKWLDSNPTLLDSFCHICIFVNNWTNVKLNKGVLDFMGYLKIFLPFAVGLAVMCIILPLFPTTLLIETGICVLKIGILKA